MKPFIEIDTEVDKERPTSWYDFLLDPAKLDSHLENLEKGKAKNPSTIDLLKLFLKHSALEAARVQPTNGPSNDTNESKDSLSLTQSKRSALLLQFCLKILEKMKIPLHTIESHIPLKFQRTLVDYVSEHTHDWRFETYRARWIIRSFFSSSITHSTQDVQDAVDALQKWLGKYSKKSEGTALSSLLAQCNFELGELAFYQEHFTQAQQHFTQSDALLNNIQYNIEANFCDMKKERLAAFRIACYSLSQPTASSPVNMSAPQATLISLERAKRTADAQAVLKLLSEDNMNFNGIGIPWNYRLSLADEPQLQSIHSNIHILNLIYQIIRSITPTHVKVQHQQHGKLLLECARAALRDAAQLSSDELKQKIFNRLQHYIRCVAISSDSTETAFLQLLLAEAPVFAVLPEDKDTLTARLQLQQHTRSQQTVAALKRKLHFEAPRSLWHSDSAEQFIHSLHTVKKAKVNTDVLIQHKLQLFTRKQQYADCERIIKSEIQLESERAVQLLQLQLHKYEQHAASSQLQEVINSCFHVLSVVLPQPQLLEKILSVLLNSSQWDTAKRYCAEFESKASSRPKDLTPPPYSLSLCRMCSILCDLIQFCNRYLSTPSEARAECSKSIETLFNNWLGAIITSDSQQVQRNMLWHSSAGILAALSNSCSQNNILEHLISLFAAAAFHLRRMRKASQYNDSVLERYGALTLFTASLQNPFTGSEHVNLSTEAVILDAFRETVLRIVKLQKHESKWIYALGDVYFDAADSTTRDPFKFKECIRNYLLAASMDTSFFTSTEKQSLEAFNTVVKRLISALCTLKANVQAAVLCQFLQPVDFALAFKVLQEGAVFLDMSYFKYFWEMPTLELLLSIYAKAKDSKKQSLLVHLIGRPELNQFNPTDVREVIVDTLKMNFLKELSKEFFC